MIWQGQSSTVLDIAQAINGLNVNVLFFGHPTGLETPVSMVTWFDSLLSIGCFGTSSCMVMAASSSCSWYTAECRRILLKGSLEWSNSRRQVEDLLGSLDKLWVESPGLFQNVWRIEFSPRITRLLESINSWRYSPVFVPLNTCPVFIYLLYILMMRQNGGTNANHEKKYHQHDVSTQ